MSSSIRLFLTGFILTSLLFLAVNVLAAYLQSDCGLPAFFNLSGCADDIRRAGFPLRFYEEGGFAYRHNFDITAFVTDLICGLALGVLGGAAAWSINKRAKQP
jgi:hypothetical protein